jgi:hypothetical protein
VASSGLAIVVLEVGLGRSLNLVKLLGDALIMKKQPIILVHASKWDYGLTKPA